MIEKLRSSGFRIENACGIKDSYGNVNEVDWDVTPCSFISRYKHF
jgi:hypothetical protein